MKVEIIAPGDILSGRVLEVLQEGGPHGVFTVITPTGSLWYYHKDEVKKLLTLAEKPV